MEHRTVLSRRGEHPRGFDKDFTEKLSFLSESEKNWVMGRAIVQRLKWT
jgi:hypothetical protein